MIHEEVFRFACSLDDSRSVLDMVFETIHKCFEDTPISFSVDDTILYMQFLKSLCEEQSTVMETNPLVGIYVDYVVREESPVFTLCSMNMEMTRNDIKLLSDAARKGCLGNVKYLNLSGNTLTDLIENLVSGEDHHGFRSLETLDLSNTGLSPTDVKSLFIALHEGKFQKLKELRFLPALLTDCLSHILQVADHPAFPFSKQMVLHRSCISKGDIKSIHKALCDGKLEHLREIDLSHNMLTDCLKELIHVADHHRFKALETIDVSNTMLNATDVSIFFKALHKNYCKTLKRLDLSGNTLTNRIKYLVFGENPHGFRSLETLVLSNTALSPTDVKFLFIALHKWKLKGLREIDLSHNILTNYIVELVGDKDYPNFSSLEKLNLTKTQLGPADVKNLSFALWLGKFPFLKKLSILLVHLTTIMKSVQDNVNDTRAIFCGMQCGEFLKPISFLKYIFSVADPQELSLLGYLHLYGIKFFKQDLITIHEVVASDKVPNLELLDLSDYILTDTMRSLFGDSDRVVFQELHSLRISNAGLTRSDLDILSQNLKKGKLPSLIELDLSGNTLTNNLGVLLDAINQNLKCLFLDETHLADTDVKDLCSAITGKKFLKLYKLSLRFNNLTNYISKVFCATTEVVLPSLYELWLTSTELVERDVAGLSKSVKSGKLPALKFLYLEQNNLTYIEELWDLMKVCKSQICIVNFIENSASRKYDRTGTLSFFNLYYSLWEACLPEWKLQLYLNVNDVIHPDDLPMLKTADCSGSTVSIGGTKFERVF